jgi:hypothetical protein
MRKEMLRTQDCDGAFGRKNLREIQGRLDNFIPTAINNPGHQSQFLSFHRGKCTPSERQLTNERIIASNLWKIG